MPELEELQRQINEVRVTAEDALDKFPIRSTTTPGASRERHIHDLGKHPGGVIAARVHNSGNISINDGTPTTLTFDSERYDTDTIHSTSSNTGRLTAKTAGKYIISASIDWATNATGFRELRLRLNGDTAIARVTKTTTSTRDQMTITTQYELAVDDFVEVRVQQNSGGALNVLATSNFSPEFMMSRVGAAGTTGGGTPGTDHGSLTGLSDDDHSLYLLAAGSRAGATGGAQDFGSNGIKADVIAESGSAVGVTIDGVLLKDSLIADAAVPATHSGSAHHTKYTDAEAIAAVEGELSLDLIGNVTIEGTKSLKVDVIDEKDSAAGVTVDALLIKDGVIPDAGYPNAILAGGTRPLTADWDIGDFDIQFRDDKGIVLGTSNETKLDFTATNNTVLTMTAGDFIVTGGGIELDDSEALVLGDGKDATLKYDGTDLLIDPQIQGTGNVVISNGGIEVTNIAFMGGSVNTTEVISLANLTETTFSRAIGGALTFTGTQNNIASLLLTVKDATSNNTAALTGLHLVVQNANTSGTVTNMYGLRPIVQIISSSATTTNMYGITFIWTVIGQPENAFGMKFPNIGHANISNLEVLTIPAQTAAEGTDNGGPTNYQIKEEGVVGDNILGGDTSIGHVGDPSATCHIIQDSTSGAQPVVLMKQDDVDEDYFKFVGTSDTSVDRALVDAADFTTAGSIKGWLKINIQDDQATNPITDADYYIPFYEAPSA